jgi:WD40 repeat protein
VVNHAEFSPDGSKVVTASRDNTACVWDLSPDPRPAEDLELLAQVVSSHRIDQTGALVPFKPDEFLAAWNELRSKYQQGPSASREWADARRLVYR